jgi:hypothetical protein
VHPELMQGLAQEHSQNWALFQKLQQALSVMTKVRKTLDGLLKLGDNVDSDDIAKAGGQLVAHGLPADTVAALMTDMPKAGGAGLAGWLQEHDLELRKQEAQFAQGVEKVRQATAVSGMHLLMAHQHQQEAAGPQPGAPSSGPASANPFLH